VKLFQETVKETRQSLGELWGVFAAKSLLERNSVFLFISEKREISAAYQLPTTSKIVIPMLYDRICRKM
jgi:hypothetical protein